MREPPQFLQTEAQPEQRQLVYRPTPSSRQGELIAWLCALGAGAGTFVLRLQTGRAMAVGLGLTAFFLLAGVLISFGQWIDRATSIRLEQDQVVYRSPLRRTRLPWPEIRQLWAAETGGGWRVGVGGQGKGFAFRTPSTLSFASMGSMPVGIAKGEELAAAIRGRAELADPVWDRGRWVCKQAGSRTPDLY